jgi:hypothetical protein
MYFFSPPIFTAVGFTKVLKRHFFCANAPLIFMCWSRKWETVARIRIFLIRKAWNQQTNTVLSNTVPKDMIAHD